MCEAESGFNMFRGIAVAGPSWPDLISRHWTVSFVRIVRLRHLPACACGRTAHSEVAMGYQCSRLQVWGEAMGSDLRPTRSGGHPGSTHPCTGLLEVSSYQCNRTA